MKTIELALESTTGYINSLTRNTVEGWWELEIGLPKGWVYDENNKIGCEIVFENEIGRLIKIFPKKKDVVVDDLIAFVEIIIHTNERIAEKEKQFKDKMQEMKGLLEKEAKTFYQELDELKENSFKNLNNAFAKNLGKPKTPRKPRKPKTETTIGEGTVTTKNAISTITEETETLESPKE
jgi:hypothetical protein